MPIWLADLRTSLVLDKLLQIVRLYTPPGTPATRQPGNAATPHRGFSYPAADGDVFSLPSPPLCCIIAHIHISTYVYVCIHTEKNAKSRVAEESSRKIASVSYTARSRAAFICHQKMLIAIFRFRLIERVCLFLRRSQDERCPDGHYRVISFRIFNLTETEEENAWVGCFQVSIM